MKPNINTKNAVRQVSQYLNTKFGINKLLGSVYFNLHNLIMAFIGFITFFTTSVQTLIFVLIIVSLDAISVVFLHECPLTTLEKKYLGFTSCEIRDEMLENAGIVYNCDHTYEKQIELLINVWLIITAKCLFILFLQMFSIKLIDVGNIYV